MGVTIASIPILFFGYVGYHKHAFGLFNFLLVPAIACLVRY